MSARTFLYVVGTRPNFMKTAPVLTAMRELAAGDRHILVHTGQHYDDDMSRVFFQELGLPAPDYYLGVGSGLPGEQTARVIEGIERLVLEHQPRVVVVPGDVTSTLGAAIAAAKHFVPVAHIEAGLRSFDRSMPEELNRVLTDQLAEILFTHSPEAEDNLLREGIDAQRIHFVGNTMIDTLVRLSELADRTPPPPGVKVERPYVLVTLHRPALVDGPLLPTAMAALDELALTMDVVFPVHPRTRHAMERHGARPTRVQLVQPLGYLEFLSLQQRATALLTDSGGVQEEASFLGIPCFTLRDNTERPVTISEGTNTLLGLKPENIKTIPRLLRHEGPAEPQGAIKGWDGQAGDRAAEVLNALA